MKNVFPSYTVFAGMLVLLTSGTCADGGPAAPAAAPAASVPAEKPDGLGIGDRADDFSLKNVDDKMVSLASYPDAKGFVVVFTCNHCPFAKMYEQRIIDLHQKWAPKGYPVVAINPNDPAVVPDDGFEEMKALAAEKKYPFAYLFDEGQKVYPKFGATRTPHVYILDKERTVRYIGAIDNNAEDAAAATDKYADRALESLSTGKNVEPDFTRAVGCSIKKQ